MAHTLWKIGIKAFSGDLDGLDFFIMYYFSESINYITNYILVRIKFVAYIPKMLYILSLLVSNSIERIFDYAF